MGKDKVNSKVINKPMQTSSHVTKVKPSLSAKQLKRDMKKTNNGNFNNKLNNFIPANSSSNNRTPSQRESVYKRLPSYPVPYNDKVSINDRFVEPDDKEYDKILATSYQGFITQPPNTFNSAFHSMFETAFTDLERDNIFQFDFTQPAGLNSKVAKTLVTRCLVGQPGITYKYLGLRMFAHPWLEGSLGCTEAMKNINFLNSQLSSQTKKLLHDLNINDGNYGSCDYNLTLINRCFPHGSDHTIHKDEPIFGSDKCTVSWHADSSLDHYSSIAVYHHVKKNALNDDGKQWKIALRVQNNAEGPRAGKEVTESGNISGNHNNSSLLKTTARPNNEKDEIAPPIAVPLPDAWSYYLLDEFNHHHQHSVLVGDNDRYASTHRVSRLDGHTFESIYNKCNAAVNQKLKLSCKSVRSEQIVLDEVEFEWIRQFYVQGSHHYNIHAWWHGPIGEFMKLWSALEKRTLLIIQALKDAAVGFYEEELIILSSKASLGDDTTDEAPVLNSNSKNAAKKLYKRRILCKDVEAQLYDEMNQFLINRFNKRVGWINRENDPIFHKVDASCKPMIPPFQSITHHLLVNHNDNNNNNKSGKGGNGTKSNRMIQNRLNGLYDPALDLNHIAAVILEWKNVFMMQGK
eukprot:gene4497-6353_t